MRHAAAVALAGVLMVGGCTSDTEAGAVELTETGAVEPTETPAAEAIVGTWYHQNEAEGEYTIVDFLADGTWAAFDADTVDTSGTPKDFGLYTVKGDTLTLGPDDYCGELLGTYTLAFNGDKKVTTPVSDHCFARRTNIADTNPMTRVAE